MSRPILILLALFVLSGALAQRGRTNAAIPSPAALDHVTTQGPSCPPYPCADIPLQDQVRYLIGHWPRDFKIAVVQATENSKCKIAVDRHQCSVRVKLVDLILGTQEPDVDPHRKGWYDAFEISYSFVQASGATEDPEFVVKSGDRLVAMLTPAIRQPGKPFKYISTRLDHASDTIIQSVANAVADTLATTAHAEAKP